MSNTMTSLANFEISFSSLVQATHNAVENPLHTFRQLIFERTREAFCQVSNATEVNLKDFWVAMKHYFDDLCNGIKMTSCNWFKAEVINALLKSFRYLGMNQTLCLQ